MEEWRINVDIVRTYTDNQGETHFEDISLDVAEVDFAPPAAPFSMSQPIATQDMIFAEFPDEWYGDWHPAPRPVYVLALTGAYEVSVSDGETRRIEPGEFVLFEDTSGKGHLSCALQGAKARALFIRLAE
jgi:hypothetical protein